MKYFRFIILLSAFWILISAELNAQSQQQNQVSIPKITLTMDGQEEGEDLILPIQILVVMTVLTLAPSILILMTCFTRIIIVFHFLRSAMGTQTQPPNQLLTGLALFLTFFAMQPVLNQANSQGIQPYLREEISQTEAVDLIVKPFLVLDMVIASTLMSLGMFLLPPQLISLPIKILLFILVDGWYLVIESMMSGIMNP